MKKLIYHSKILLKAVLLGLFLVNCSKDEVDTPPLPPGSITIDYSSINYAIISWAPS